MGAHLIDAEFQSDKYPTCPRGKVPLSVRDTTAQDLLWEYAQRRRAVDAEFADDLETALVEAGFTIRVCAWCSKRRRYCAASVELRDEAGRWILEGAYGSRIADMCLYMFIKNEPAAPANPVCDECIQARIFAGDLERIDANYLGDPLRPRFPSRLGPHGK